MTKPTLHIPQKDSPSTYLITAITNEDDRITVADSSIFQTDPNNLITRLTLGFDSATTETVEVTEYGPDNLIHIIRKSDGKPSYSWAAGTKVARVFTARDVNEYIEYFDYLDSEKTTIATDLENLTDTVNDTINPIINLQKSWSGKKSIFRGADLGSTFTSAQIAAIQSGAFDDLYLGDYWRIGQTLYMIADFNYWFNPSLNEMGNHIVVIPMQCLATKEMDTNAGDSPPLYFHTSIRSYLLNTILPIVSSVFNHHVGEYTENLPSNNNRINKTISIIELMSESMVYGQGMLRSESDPTYSIGQLALFKVRPDYINAYQKYWLRDRSGSYYCAVDNDGLASFASNYDQSVGIRPCFPVCGMPVH